MYQIQQLLLLSHSYFRNSKLSRTKNFPSKADPKLFEKTLNLDEQLTLKRPKIALNDERHQGHFM